MHQLYNDLAGFSLAAKDEVFGGVADVYFDDKTWRLRYLVAQTGTWLNGRDTLVAVGLLGEPDTSAFEWPVDLTRAEVEQSAAAKHDPPVSVQRVNEFASSWPNYMVFPEDMVHPTMMAVEDIARLSGAADAADLKGDGDPNLRSMTEVKGYAIDARGEAIGAVQDFVIDPKTWRISHFVVDIGAWLPGKLVVVSTDRIEKVSWRDRSISVDIGKDAIENSPSLDDLSDVDRPEEPAFYLNHGFAPV